ncbi:hypothetical protein DVA86_03130 [Streptomyces armeniacus]|uniref:DUF3828 domain-containing protein n=1 Tax=Streptomyces armeniacus TaxID=83291 RepID=A0A345XJH3_9ACTN|nr:hypothetical protein [Streptomyces armeniacus]AXK31789.1 hypothetical protein DVA86_03130 [Streptomyces armeniacus]
MSHHRRSRRTKRNSIVAGAVAAVLIPLGVAGTAMAGGDSSGGTEQTGPKQTAQQAAAQDTPSVVTEVEEFYQGYISALGEGDTEQAKSLRKAALTESFQNELAEWEQQNAADGVTRSQNVPVEAEAAYDGSGMGHSWTIVTLKWDGGSDATKLHVQSDLDTHRISDVKPLD